MKTKLLYSLLIPFFLLLACKKKEVEKEVPVEPPVVDVVQKPFLISSPVFPSADADLTFTIDLEKGNGALKGIDDIYVHIGVITDKSTGPSDWKYVKNSAFNTATPNTKLTKKQGSQFQFTLSPRQFLGVPAGEEILKLAMVFRNADGSKVGRNADGSDVYLPLYKANKLYVKFLSPEMEPLSVPAPAINVKFVGQELVIEAVSSKKADLSLKVNGKVLESLKNVDILKTKLKIEQTGSYEVVLEANDGTETSVEKFDFMINSEVKIAPLPSGAKEGVVLLNGGKSAIITLYAPKKQNIYLIGDFNDWRLKGEHFMNKATSGDLWWIQIDNLEANKEYAYQFKVDGNLTIADPYAEKVLDPYNDFYIPAITYPNLKSYPTGKTTGVVSVFSTKAENFTWTTTNVIRPQKNNLVIYELLVRDFVEKKNYQTLVDSINYLKNLGVNAIELLPINEFEGNSSWGYNPSFYFAADKYYGTKEALKNFIDVCHKNGMAVILDVVLNHSFGQSPMVQLYFDGVNNRPSADNIWFNPIPKHPFNVGYDFNHESQSTKRFVKNVLKFWIDEYKIDGFRFDLSKGFTQKGSGTSDVGGWSAYDAGRIAIWKDYNNYIKSVAGNNFYVILEHFADDSEERELAAEGMMLWNNMNHAFTEATMGFVPQSNLSRAFHTAHGFSNSENLITYMESHDEERMMYKNIKYGNASGSYNIKNLETALKRQEMAMAFLMAIPGPKMLWQFGELGYDVEIDYNGRTGEKPLRWNYFKDPNRLALYKSFSKLIKMKINNEVFTSQNIKQNTAGSVKQITLQSASNKVVVYGNFDVEPKSVTINFPNAGIWTNYLTQQKVNVTENLDVQLQPGEFYILSEQVMK